MALAGGLLAAQGELQAGEAAQRASEFNAKIAEQNAVQAIALSAQEERQQRIIGRKAIGEMKAAFGASGFEIEGSAMDVLAESAAAAELDALNIRYAGQSKAINLRNEARMQRYTGEQARIASQYRAAATVLNSATQTGMQAATLGMG